MNTVNALIKLTTAIISHPAIPIALMGAHYAHEHNILEWITKF